MGAGLCGARGHAQVSAIAETAKGNDASDSVVLKLNANQLEEFRECFNAFDKDGGGSIDSDELGARTQLHPPPRRARLG